MVRTACLLLGLFLDGGAGQAAEWSEYSQSVAALCDVSEGAQAQGNPPTGLDTSNVEQTAATKVRVSAPGSPDAVWLTDTYGEIVDFEGGSPNLPLTLDFGTDASTLKLFAHYPSCYITSTGQVDTWKKKYQDYVSGDSASYSGTFTAAQIASTLPVFGTVSYTSNPKTASITFTQQAGVNVPHATVTDDRGAVLMYDTTISNGVNTMTVEIPAQALSLTACTLTCATYSLAKDIVEAIEASNTAPSTLTLCQSASTATPCDLPIDFRSDVLAVRPSTSCAASCTGTAGCYSLYATTSATEPPLAYGQDQALTVDVQDLTSVTIKQRCGGVLSSMTVQLAPLRTAYAQALEDAANGPTPTDNSVKPVTCTMDGVSHAFNEVWEAKSGASCMCIQGVTECGAVLKRGIYFDTAGVVGVTISVVLMAGIGAACVYYSYMQKKAREVVEGKTKRFSGATYATHGAGSNTEGQEVELPSASPSNAA